MDGIFHYGKDSEQYIHAFEGKWADYILQAIMDWPVKDLTVLLSALKQENRTFVESKGTEV